MELRLACILGFAFVAYDFHVKKCIWSLDLVADIQVLLRVIVFKLNSFKHKAKLQSIFETWKKIPKSKIPEKFHPKLQCHYIQLQAQGYGHLDVEWTEIQSVPLLFTVYTW